MAVALNRCAVTLSIAAALLAGCGGSQPPIGAPALMPQSRAIAQHTAGEIQGRTKRGTLLYVATNQNLAYVIAYPGGTLAQTLMYSRYGGGGGVCSDARGNVFITAYVGSPSAGGYVFEFAHGGKTPIATLADGTYWPGACAIDPTTGNLAVANDASANCGYGGNVAVYSGAQGAATFYTDSSFECIRDAAYDNHGNLFVGGKAPGSTQLYQLAELAIGSSTLTNVALDEAITCVTECVNGLQWDGRHLAITKPSCISKCYEAQPLRAKSPIIYQVSVTGSTGNVLGSTKFQGKWASQSSGDVSLIKGNEIVMQYHPQSLAIWKYPGGGKMNRTLTKGLHYRLMQLTLSQ